jgi:methylthioribose-1-phosphate isomerase
MTTNAIAWMDGALVAIDQRALPRQVRQLRITTVDEVIDAINTLAVRGAPTIGMTGAFGVVLAAFAHQGDAKKVELEAARIASARPTAVNLAWSVHRVLARLPEGEEAVLGEALKMLDEADHVNRAAATYAADLVQQLCPDRPLRLLTHCNTGWLAATAFGTALGALRVLHARDAIEKVLVDETRPLMQGSRLTTWELAEAGIPHKLMIDSAAAWAMAIGQVDCVLVGADRICADGSVANKIGTYNLALAARHHSIPFIVVAPESTRDPETSTGHEVVVEERAAAEITHVGGVATAPEGTAAFNPAFDVTPAELVTAIVTENGVIEEVTIVADSSDPDAAHRPLAWARSGIRAGDDAAVAKRPDYTSATGGIVGRAGKRGVVNVTEPGNPGSERGIAALAHELHARGWMPGTSGNISVRDGQTAVITGSGLSKGELTAQDMVTVNIADSQRMSGTKDPSAETAIHTAIYRATGASAVVHVHPPHATVQSINAPNVLRFAGYELIKGLGAAETVDIPVVPNHKDVPHIGADIERYLIEHPDAPPVLFIAAHGITAWGAHLAEARDRAECLEAMCELAVLSGRREVQLQRCDSQRN